MLSHDGPLAVAGLPAGARRPALLRAGRKALPVVRRLSRPVRTVRRRARPIGDDFDQFELTDAPHRLFGTTSTCSSSNGMNMRPNMPV